MTIKTFFLHDIQEEPIDFTAIFFRIFTQICFVYFFFGAD